MKIYFDEIEKRLKEKIKFEKIEIINNSHKHRGHKFFSEDKYHLHLKIKSLYLKSISRLNAQKLILNTISTTLMIKLGRVKDNKMIDMQLSNNKLINRAERILMKELSIDNDKAKSLLEVNKSVRKSIENNK